MTTHRLSRDPRGVNDVLRRDVFTCRSRLREVLESLDGRPPVPVETITGLIETSRCPEGHDLHYASLMGGAVLVDDEGLCRLGADGADWLLDGGRPAPDWHASTARGASPLRVWQAEALDAWVAHGRHGVVEAVTGTGKSRVGVEAAREALADDYAVVVAVPTRDLVEQWVAALRESGLPGVTTTAERTKNPARRSRVLVGTVQSLYLDPPTREDGKILLVADECHRYGAGRWRQVLHSSYRRRLGLTATFERNDDGIKDLLQYFGGTPVYRIGFDRAIADGVVAHYDVKLQGVTLFPNERAAYNRAHKTVVESRTALLAAGFPAEPFGLFLQQVADAAEDESGDEDPTIVDVARRYLKAFSERVEILASAAGKLGVVRDLAPTVEKSGGTLLFTRTVAAAEEIAATLAAEGVAAEAIHSGLTQTQRRARLQELKRGRLRAVAAPTVLDEGVDVPATDLAVVLGGSKSRRQMIQRMGRVLRLKADGHSATFIVVYARNTVEDLTLNDGQEGCLDLIMQSADSVEHLGLVDLQGVVHPAAASALAPPIPQVAVPAVPMPSVPPDDPPEQAEEESRSEPVPAWRTLKEIDPERLPLTRAVLDEYRRLHGGSEQEAEEALRSTLADLIALGLATDRSVSGRAAWTVKCQDVAITVDEDRFVNYRCHREDQLAWVEVRGMLEQTRAERSVDIWIDRPWPDPRHGRLQERLLASRPLSRFTIEPRAIDVHTAMHQRGSEQAQQDIRRLLTDLARDQDRSSAGRGALATLARSGYTLTVDLNARTVIDYQAHDRGRTYGQYLDYGRTCHAAGHLSRECPEQEDALEIDSSVDLMDYLDLTTIFYGSKSRRRLLEAVGEAYLNEWDLDRLMRYQMYDDLRRAECLQRTEEGNYIVAGAFGRWIYRQDGLAVILQRPPCSEDARGGVA